MTTELNYHHLRYFWAVAKDGNLTRTAARLRVAQSALSMQIRQLEGQLGQALFTRAGRSLVLTEAGALTLRYADTIFGAGGELVATLARGRRRGDVLHVGAVATLSRNFQESFVRPALGRPKLRLRLWSGSFDDLLRRLAAHELDVVLANRPAERSPDHEFRSTLVAQQPVSIVGRPRRARFRFPSDLGESPLLVPGPDSEVRLAFDALCARLGVRYRIFAEVDDMATMRLLARDSQAMALLPSVVVRDELRAKALAEYAPVPGLFESFYAITVARQFPHPTVKALLARDAAELLDDREA